MRLRHYLVSGRVQGVGFRRFVEKQAKAYEVSGLVRNLEDGRVEFYAKGKIENLEEFDRAVRRGPMLSVVRDVIIRTLDKPEGLDQDWSTGLFKIASDGLQPWIEDRIKENR
jgi:acylphosphatase